MHVGSGVRLNSAVLAAGFYGLTMFLLLPFFPWMNESLRPDPEKGAAAGKDYRATSVVDGYYALPKPQEFLPVYWSKGLPPPLKPPPFVPGEKSLTLSSLKIQNTLSPLDPLPLQKTDPGYRKKHDPLFHDIIMEASRQHEIDPALIKAIIMAESAYNPKAVSTAGARGLMQLMPETAKDLGIEDAFDPLRNIQGGVRYFKRLFKDFDGDVELALAAYNAGSYNVRKYKGVPPFAATRKYIKRVLKFYEKYKRELDQEAGDA